MNKRSRTGRVAHGVLAMLTLMGAATLNAATINVSGGGSALQTAISNASAGDILLVAPALIRPSIPTTKPSPSKVRAAQA